MTANRLIDGKLLAATCALLGTATAPAARADEVEAWSFDSALLYYGETDDRVQDLSLNVLAVREFADDRSLSLNLSVDTLTGASASGAIAQDTAQTFTSPSGSAVYSTAASEVPLDDTFLDTRIALSAGWSQPIGRLYRGTAGVSFSKEYDYLHQGVNFALERDFNKRNTTLSAALAFSRDDWEPVGGAPVPLAQMAVVGDQSVKRGDDSKDITDLLLGITQVINRDLIMQFNYSYSDASGYLNDPYKILSVVDGVTGDTLPFVLPPGSQGPSGVYRFESRPESRARHSLFSRAKYYFDGKVLDMSYRFADDDWDISSHTLDMRLRWPLGESAWVEPHVRLYSQSEAEFYRASLVDGAPLPAFASADFRLGDFDAWTAGVEYGRVVRNTDRLSLRLEYYQQSGSVPADQIIGAQAGREQYPDLGAIIVQLSYRFGL